MRDLTERLDKMKKRAEKLQQKKQADEHELELKKAKEKEKERMLIAKPSKELQTSLEQMAQLNDNTEKKST